MGKIRFFMALWAAKLSIIALKITRHNGTNFPGIVAIKICPDFLKQVKKPGKIIGITGTNGKTTVCNLAIDMFKQDGKAVLNNNLGSNINTGIATAFITGTGIFGRVKYDTAVLEMDERSAPLLFPTIKPDWLLINNLTRDSIMRNGHPEYIGRILTEEMYSKTKLLLNGDDLIASSIAPDNERKYFGIESLDSDVTECINLVNDLRICPKCNSLLKYRHRRYHHIGKAYCPDCGFESPKCDYEGKNVDLEQMTIDIEEKDGTGQYRLLNDSVFNIYNVVAIVALFRELGYSKERVAELLSKVEIVKSRFDVKEVGGHRIIKQMSKDRNSLGTSRAFDYVSGRPGDKELILMMNNLSDSRHWSENVCWLYDADFEFLNKDDIKNIIVTGPRAKDYYLRLKMAGIDDSRISFAEHELDSPQKLKLYENADIYILYGTDSIELCNSVASNVEKVIAERGETA